jgi:hypothetical protein
MIIILEINRSADIFILNGTEQRYVSMKLTSRNPFNNNSLKTLAMFDLKQRPVKCTLKF